MRILQIHNRYKIAGGEDIVAANEAALLRLHGHTVREFAVSNNDIRGLRSELRVASSVAYSFASRARVAAEIAEFRPHIVHAHNIFPLLTPSVYDACANAGVPVVQTLHNYRLGCINGILLRDNAICEKCWIGSSYWGALHKCYRGSRLGSLAAAYAASRHRSTDTWNQKVARFITLTNFAREKFVELGIRPEKLAVKGNFSLGAFANEHSNAARHGALFVGRLSSEKGIMLLIEAWNSVCYPLTIIGDGPLLGDVRRAAGSHIMVRGRIESKEVHSAMSQAAFLVFPSICYEGFPMVIVEAFACGLPVLGANIGGIAELVGSDGGLLFAPNSSVSLRQAAFRLIEDERACQTLGVSARARYEQEYSPEKNYLALMQIYQSVS